MRHRTRLHSGSWFMAVCCAAVVGCSGNGEGLDINGRPLTSATPDTGLIEPTLADIQRQVFTPTCAVSGCHTGASAPLGLQLDSGSAFANLVNQPSTQQPGIARVDPGNPDASYLIQKLEGTAASGAQMPRNQPPLSSSTISVIREWIANGAPGPTLSAIQRTLFNPVCTPCHSRPNAAANLVLEQGLSHQHLVSVKSQADSRNRVESGHAKDSFLMIKLTGHGLREDQGVRMPYGGPFVGSTILSAVEQWINDGAKVN